MFTLSLTCESFIISCRSVIQLITDVIYFLGHLELSNHQGDCLDLVIGKPDRERQKLIREQNILKQVGRPILKSDNTVTEANVLLEVVKISHSPEQMSKLEKLSKTHYLWFWYTHLWILVGGTEFMHCAEIALVDYGRRLEHLWRYLYAVRNINTCAPNTHLHRGSTGIETIASRR